MSQEADFLAYAHKIVSEDAPKHLQLEIAKASKEGAFAYGRKLLAPWMKEMIDLEAQIISIENHQQERQATNSHVPYYRRGRYMTFCYEMVFGEGCWQDNDFVEDTLRHYPGLRCKVKYGTKGQEYVSPRK